MKIDFNNIDRHSVSINDFRLKWRFTDPKYDVLPDIHLEQLKPLDKDAAKFISDFISRTDLHADVPFKKGFFQTIDKTKITADNKQEIKKWLYQRGLPFDKNVYLCWDEQNAMIVPWKIFLKYFDRFYYGGSDDLNVCDESLQWALMLYHEDEIYDGMRLDYKIDNLGAQAFYPTDDGCYIIRFKATNANKAAPAVNLSDPDPFPYTNHGFTSGMKGKLGVPEWKMPDAEITEGIIFRKKTDGTEIEYAVWNATINKFVVK